MALGTLHALSLRVLSYGLVHSAFASLYKSLMLDGFVHGSAWLSVDTTCFLTALCTKSLSSCFSRSLDLFT